MRERKKINWNHSKNEWMYVNDVPVTSKSEIVSRLSDDIKIEWEKNDLLFGIYCSVTFLMVKSVWFAIFELLRCCNCQKDMNGVESSFRDIQIDVPSQQHNFLIRTIKSPYCRQMIACGLIGWYILIYAKWNWEREKYDKAISQTRLLLWLEAN